MESDFAGTTEGPRRVRDGAFLFGHERIVANPDHTRFGVTSGWSLARKPRKLASSLTSSARSAPPRLRSY
jgi:hypothetical protein